MNCKPGDLAWIIGASEYAGMLVDVISAPPIGAPFNLPDGSPHRAVDQGGYWVLKSLGSKFKVPTNYGTKFNEYAVGDDRSLRPIRPGDLNETTDERKEVTA